MPDTETRLESLLFDYETTYRTAFRKTEIKAPVLTTYKKKERCMMIRPPPLRDVHTLSDWKAAAIPFDLLLQRKDIVGTNPHCVQKKYEKPKDLGREEAQKTRPRLVMTPAVSMDDVTDARARNILCEDIYTSDMTRGQREAVSPYFSVTAPLPGPTTNSNPITLRKLQLPVVSPQWRMETVTWDNNQLRGYCDPSKEFWLRHELNECRACEETKTMEAHRKMQRKMKAGRR